MAKQDIKKLAMKYHAKVDLDSFEDLFKIRMKESGIKIPLEMEAGFLKSPESAQEKRIAKLILDWRENETNTIEQEMFKQKKRFNDAVKKLTIKETKAALNDKRISSEKIEKLKAKHERLNKKVTSDEGRIFPHIYAPLIVMEKGKRIIRPFRYHLRPMGQSVDFDRDYDGTYNARRDRLQEVFWWKNIYGAKHGIMIISKFWENVSEAKYNKKKLKDPKLDKNLVLEFAPEEISELIVPCIFDRNEEGDYTLNSFALITDEPNPEVAAAGHDRTPIFLKEEYVDIWLEAKKDSIKKYEKIFDDKQPTYFNHRIAA